MWIACVRVVSDAREVLGACLVASCERASVSCEVQLEIVSLGVRCGRETVRGNQVTVSDTRSRWVDHTHVR